MSSLPATSPTRNDTMQSSTHDLVNALNIISAEINSPDGVPNAVCAEAAQRLIHLVSLTVRLSEHILSNPVHHPKCNAYNGNYCNCVLSEISSIQTKP